MTTQHTPGPWKLAEAVESRHTKTNLRRIRSEREGLDHGAVCEVYGIADGSEAHCNARLIAAAPDLLAALERANTLLAELTFSEWIPKKGAPSIDIRQRINAAHVIAASSLAKATGSAA